MNEVSIGIGTLGTVFLFAALNEALIEYLFGSIQNLRPYLPTIALMTGVVLSFLYNIDIFNIFLGINSEHLIINHLLSGFVISRGSNFVNDFARKVLGSK